jgi:hypothetical protein
VLAVLAERARENLDSDVTSELGVAGAINLAHPTGADQFVDLEDADAAAGQRCRHRHYVGGGDRHVVRKGICVLVEGQQRLDLGAQGRIDVMIGVVRLAIGRRSVGEFAKDVERLGMHSARCAVPPRCRL